jgi:hypothetical protein
LDFAKITNPRVLFGALGYIIRVHFPGKGLIPRRFRDNFLALPKGRGATKKRKKKKDKKEKKKCKKEDENAIIY